MRPRNSKESIKANNKKHIQKKWENQWYQEIYLKKNQRSIVQAQPKPDLNCHKIHQALSNCASRWITWCRMNYLPLNHFLNYRQSATSSKCPHCDHHDETLHHFLFDCPKFRTIRLRTIDRYLTINYHTTNQLQFLLNNPIGQHCVINYIARTKRFGGKYCLTQKSRSPLVPMRTKWSLQPSNYILYFLTLGRHYGVQPPPKE